MLSAKIGHSLDPLILRLYRLIFKDRIINPNVVTLCGAALSVGVCIAVGYGWLIVGGLFLVASGLLDLADGALARTFEKVTPFGGFLDSVLDRYSDLIVLLGVLIYFVREGDAALAIITFVASIGTAIIPYARARAEAAGISCMKGILERPERLLIILLGLFLNLLTYAVLILAVLTHVTVLQRILHVKGKAQ